MTIYSLPIKPYRGKSKKLLRCLIMATLSLQPIKSQVTEFFGSANQPLVGTHNLSTTLIAKRVR